MHSLHRITSKQEIVNKIASSRDCSGAYFTNYFFSEKSADIQIRRGLYSLEHSNSIVLFFEEKKCIRVFMSGNMNILVDLLRNNSLTYENKPLATDLIGTKKSILSNILQLEDVGFIKHDLLIRSNRMFNPNDVKIEADDNIINARERDADVIENMHELYFEPITDRLPDREEIVDAILAGNVRVIRDGGSTVAFHWHEVNGISTLSRYACVYPDYRTTGAFFALTNDWIRTSAQCKRRNIWVRENNKESSIGHLIFGFKPDGIVDQVMKRGI